MTSTVEPRWAVDIMLDAVDFDGEVLDPCCGIGTIVSACLDRGIPDAAVTSSTAASAKCATCSHHRAGG